MELKTRLLSLGWAVRISGSVGIIQELIVEAFGEALTDAKIDRNDIEMAWLGLFFQEQSAGNPRLL